MYELVISLDNVSFKSKPLNNEIGCINNRIARNVVKLDNDEKIFNFINNVSNNGYTFCPATFKNRQRKLSNFNQIQLLTLDFDGGISFNEVIERAKNYELFPLFAYETLTSIDQNKFRLIFLNETSITNTRLAKISLNAIMTIFPEADKSCDDIAKMYFGGKKILYLDQSFPTVNIESILRNMTYYLKNVKGLNHYKKHIWTFAKKHKIKINKKGLIDISIIESETELFSTTSAIYQIGKNSPSPILIYNANGENLPNTYTYYKINLDVGCTGYSVNQKHAKNHNEFRSSVLNEISSSCQLFNDFMKGKRRLHHLELFGLATNIIYVERGIDTFKKIISGYSIYYDNKKIEKWDFYLKYIKDQNYKKMNCCKFCPYYNICQPIDNILSTIKQKHGTIEKINGYNDEYYPIETIQEDLKDKLNKAVYSDNKIWHIIKAQTAIGKTETYLELMKTLGLRFIIAVPTNKLKNDIYNRAIINNLDIIMTPSIDEYKDKMPPTIWEQIINMRRIGKHSEIHKFILKKADEENNECLKEYIILQERFQKHSGHVITTHRKILNMSEKELNKYDVVIIDEDIIFSSIMTNQCEIPVKIFKKILKELPLVDVFDPLKRKICELLKKTKKERMFTLQGFDIKKIIKKGYEEIFNQADIPAFCLAKHFLYRKYKELNKYRKESIVFLKPYKFKNIKYIMLSATVDKDICEYCFGKQNVIFYECKTARYTGTLNQYYNKSMSRINIDSNLNIINKIIAWTKFIYMITFKKYNIGDIYFGNAIGCDYLKGQNINIVGTPHAVDFIYKLLPFTFGININKDAELKSCLVRHNGYQFYFTTFGEEDSILRKFQFWMIETELEQAVGRARLLRYNCTVNLFSNFPLKQAIMKKLDF